MYTGTSELQLAQTADINTPVLNVTMRSNFTKGAVETSEIRMSQIADALVFNNLLIVAGTSSTPNFTTGVQSYIRDEGGVSLVLDINLRVPNSFNSADLIVAGNTLTLYYSNSGASVSIYKISSQDGLTWGGTQIVANSANSIISLAATGTSRVYALVSPGSTTFAPFPIKYLTNLVSFTRGATFTGHTLFLSNFYGEKVFVEDKPDSKDIENGIIIGSRSNTGENIYKFKSDGRNLFGFSPTYEAAEGQILALSATNINKGSSRYILSLEPTISYVDNTTGVSINYVVYFGQAYTTSVDFENWSNLKFLGITSPTPLAVASKLSGSDFSVFGSSGSPLIKVFSGEHILDVSDRILNYSNTDNERINLTLGNYGDVNV